jgi:hypothetical protein
MARKTRKLAPKARPSAAASSDPPAIINVDSESRSPSPVPSATQPSEEAETDEQELGTCFSSHSFPHLTGFSERLHSKWRSPIYAFFDSKIKIGYDKDSRKFHFFKCGAKKCLNHGLNGVRRYQDSQDRGATSNLKTHASKCFGDDVVDTAFGLKTSGKGDSSIFAAFTRQGQQPVKVTHRARDMEETR